MKSFSAARTVAVTGILVVHDGAAWLRECLDALSLQTRPMDSLVIVDTGSTDDSLRIVAKHDRIRLVIGKVSVLSAPHDSTFGGAVGHAVERLTLASEPGSDSAGSDSTGSDSARPPSCVHWLWLLHDDSAAAPGALAQLLDAARRSPSVGVAGPKLVAWDDPSRLLEVGSVITRSGRRVGGPATGEHDQGQHDHRSDVLGVSTSGMLIRRDVFDTLGGFDPAFGLFRDDLDLCWRAQLAGYRVVVAPRARMREASASTSGRRAPGLSADAARRRDRRLGSQVALARCSPYVAPLLALWIALASLGSAVGLLVAKRPRRAWAALGDLGALLTPWRPMGARWRSRRLHRVRRRDLRVLFASPKAGFGQILDTIHDTVAPQPRAGGPPGWVDGNAGGLPSLESARALKSDRFTNEAQAREQPLRSTGWRILRHPGFLVVSACVLLAAMTWRSLLGALIPSSLGLAGGELLPVSSDASGLWHAWLDGWHGAGMGSALEPAPYLPVLAAGAWVLEQLPFVGASMSSVSIWCAWLLAAAIPASAWTAFLGARVVIRAPWPRAWAAAAWASLATLTTAMAAGALGAVVAHVLLPLVAAGFVCAARRSASSSAILGAALALGVTGAFNPALGAVGALAALVLLVVGPGRTRLRAAVLLLVPIGLLGPWILQVVDRPWLLLTGRGLTVWLGSGLDLAALVLIAAALRGFGSGPWRPSLSHLSWRRALVALVATAAVLGILASMAVAGWVGVGKTLTHRVPSTPAVAEDQARGPLGSRLLLLTSDGDTIGYRLVGAEPGPVVRDLLGPVATPDPLLAAAVRSTVGTADSTLPIAADGMSTSAPDGTSTSAPDGTSTSAPDGTSANATGDGATTAIAPHDALANLGVGFVAFRGAPTEPLASQLDATAGLSRLSNNKGLILWRVLPRGNAVAPSRLRLVDASGAPLASIATTGDHGRTDIEVGAATLGGSAGGRRLVVAEPNRWAAHARVTFEGRPLAAIPGTAQPTYPLPSSAGRLSITLAPTYPWWRWGQLGLLLAVLFLAAPFGSTRPNRAPTRAR